MVSRGREGRETSCGRAASPDTESLTDSPAQPPDARSGTRLNPRSELDLMRLDGDPDRTARPPPRRPGRTGELSPDRDRSPDDAVTEDLQAMCVSLLGAAGHGLSVPATSGRGCERPSEDPVSESVSLTAVTSGAPRACQGLPCSGPRSHVPPSHLRVNPRTVRCGPYRLADQLSPAL